MTDQLDVVRAFYRAVNRGDTAGVAEFYDPACIVEHVFTHDAGVYEGREQVAARWDRELATRRGVLPGGARVNVSRIAGMETGWGWVLAEWIAGSRAEDAASDEFFAGYSHFWVEHGLIRRHRSVMRQVDALPQQAQRAPSDRRYPTRPLVGVGAVVTDSNGRVVLVKRRNEPLAGQWSLPGGTLDLGETLEAGVAREVLEETGLIVDVGPVVEVFDRILLDETGRVHYHFVLIDYLCTPRGGTLGAGSDVSEVTLADPADLAPYRLTEKARDVIMTAMRKAIAVTLLLLATAGPAWADLKFTTRMQMQASTAPATAPADPVLTMFGTRLADTMLPGGSVETTTVIGDKGMRVEWSTAMPGLPAGSVMLGRPDGSVVMLNPSQKTYWRMSAAAVKTMMGGPMPTVTTKKTGQYDDVLGVRCEKVTFEMRVPIPAAPGAQQPAGFPTELAMDGESCIAEKYLAYARMLARVPGLSALGGEKLAEGGLPLRQITRSNAFGPRQMESLVTKIAEENVPAGTYEIPAGFKEVPAPGGGR